MTRDHIEAAAGWAVIFGLFFAFWIVTPAHAAEPWPRWAWHDYAAFAVGTLFILPSLILIAYSVSAALREMHRGVADPHAEPHGDVPHHPDQAERRNAR